MDYKSTINLPQTEFPMKADLPVREPLMLARWEQERVYEAMLARRQGASPFVLHDGPPYANGHIHFGHILNKVLKDIVVKSRAMAGYYTPFQPGWDCHGLPIELAAEKEIGSKGPRDVLAIRRACRTYAEKFVVAQRDEFRRMGCFGMWDAPYRTMDFSYQAEIARRFADLYASGAVYSGKKPIAWCPSCRTALAEAEIEYEDHTSPSIYVKFKLCDAKKIVGDETAPVFVVIWTTTPWTLPANRAITVHPDFVYALVRCDRELFIIARERVDAVMTELGKSAADFQIVREFSGKDLEHATVQRPLPPDNSSVVLCGDHVTLDVGTGCVHTAPGHGMDDYIVSRKPEYQSYVDTKKILPDVAVDHAGKFLQGDPDVPPALHGKGIAEANPLIIEMLRASGHLLFDAKIQHQYPHCWRCHKPLLFRATEQWFVSMHETQLRERACSAIANVTWIPQWGRHRIEGMMQARPDWCISRQRVWGVPIVAVRCASCSMRSTTPEFIRAMADQFEQHGADYWYTQPIEKLLPNKYCCPHCKKTNTFIKENDILDVWFDSGSSFAAALQKNLHVDPPADLYLEGSDQHRGWFHTSLLVALGTTKTVPYKAALTHGFVVDGQGKKYSKSAKNYVPPDSILKQYGAELLRLWVAAEDYRSDIRVSDEILKRLAESYRKIRNTWRFLLGNLFDFDPARDAVSVAQLQPLERWVLHETQSLIAKCRAAYESYEFHLVYHAVTAFCTVTLSSRYLDICKDRLYCEATTGASRRGAQTVLWMIGDALTRLMAPILSFTAEEVWGYLPGGAARGSVFVADLPSVDVTWQLPSTDVAAWERRWAIRELATKALETARQEKIIGNALGATLTIAADTTVRALLDASGVSSPDFFLVSSVNYGAVSGTYQAQSESLPGIAVSVAAATGTKCERCWKLSADVGAHAAHPTLCERCAIVVA